MYAIECEPYSQYRKVRKKYLLPVSQQHEEIQDERTNGTCGVACRQQNQMMTSVTLPSSSGPMHGGFTTGVAGEPVDSESFFETPPRPVKRCLPDALAFSCKKRRKQATPVRISSADSPPEGKPQPPNPSPEPDLNCPIYPPTLNTPEQQDLQTLITTTTTSSEHPTLECKREPEESPLIGDDANNTNTAADTAAGSEQIVKPELPWLAELPNKEWMNTNLLSFPPTNHMFMGLPQFSQPDSMPPRQPIRIFNPDAYCKLCNKEFCNKYFLKTHKANKHGIYTDPPTASDTNAGSMASVTIPSYISNMKIPTSLFNIDVKMESKTYPELYPNQFATKIFSKTSKPSSLYEVNLNENQESACSLSATNGLVTENPLDEPNADESSSPRVMQNETTSFKQEFTTTDQENFYTSPSKLSPVQLQNRDMELANRYRRIGVMNPKAFCEICCKEYCNKYFLRTHKMKRHGIFIPDDRDKDNSMKMDQAMLSYTQTSPLNLIIGEQSNSSDRKTSSPSDICCDSCGIKFQNLSLYQLHNVSVHSSLPNADPPISSSTNSDEKAAEKNADTISEDLQKLQTMILQLNDLDVSKANSVCASCNKEFENRYYLHAHMMTEHGLLLDDNADTQKSNDTDANNINNNTMCDLCGKDFHNYDDMKKHIYEIHQNAQRSPEVKEEFNNGFPPIEKSARASSASNAQANDRKPSMSLTPTSSYCEICNKELCNKYFMKTHMQRMHGIEIENGAQIGGVICDICNKELCSKYFLRVHKHNTHGIVEYGSGLLQPRKIEEASAPAALPPAVDPDPALKPSDLADLSHRYFTHFTEVCTICNRRFRSTKWLKAHLLSDHRQAGAEKWAELEQQLQQTMAQPKTLSLAANKANERTSPALKVPCNSADPANSSSQQPQQQQQQQKVGLQNVLSTIFGADDSTAKSYNCSFCPFSTPVLPFLFVHERSHSLPSNSVEGGETNQQLKLMQTFTQPDILQHHILSQNPFLPLPPFFNGNNDIQGEVIQEASESTEEVEEGNVIGNATEDIKPLQLQPQHQQPQQQQAVIKTSKKSSVNSKRKATKSLEMPPEMEQTLKEVARKMQFPATYALPQSAGTSNANAIAGNEESLNSSPPYVMQAFVVEESSPPSTATTANADQKFMPSIVFLPVTQKLSSPITATFTLTPA